MNGKQQIRENQQINRGNKQGKNVKMEQRIGIKMNQEIISKERQTERKKNRKKGREEGTKARSKDAEKEERKKRI